MVRSVAARARLALAFWMPLASFGPARTERSVAVCDTVAPGSVHESRSTAGSTSHGAIHRAFAFGVRALS